MSFLDDYRRAEDAFSETRRIQKQDYRFVELSKQWPSAIEASRRAAGLPVLTMNLLRRFERKVEGDILGRSLDVKFIAVDDPSLADVLNRLQNYFASFGTDARGVAVRHMLIHGEGWYSLLPRHGEIRYGVEKNPFVFLVDPDAVTLDDARYLIKYVYLPKDSVKGVSFPKDDGDWYSGDRVKVCEYWKKERVRVRFASTPYGLVEVDGSYSGDVVERDVWVINQELRTRDEVIKRVETRYTRFPYIRMIAEEVFDPDTGHVIYEGLCRIARDPQLFFNYIRTMQAEYLMLGARQPWMTRKGTLHRKEDWVRSHHPDIGVLEFTGSDPPRRADPPVPPQGWDRLSIEARQAIMDTMGLPEAFLGARSNERTGRAIEKRALAVLPVIRPFVSAYEAAIRDEGYVLLDLIPKTYRRDELVRILGEDDPSIDKLYAVDVPHIDIRVTLGPNLDTERQEKAKSLMELMDVIGEEGARRLAPLALRNMDIPGIEEVMEALGENPDEKIFAIIEGMIRNGLLMPGPRMMEAGDAGGEGREAGAGRGAGGGEVV